MSRKLWQSLIKLASEPLIINEWFTVNIKRAFLRKKILNTSLSYGSIGMEFSTLSLKFTGCKQIRIREEEER